jgi:transposase
VCVPEDRDAEPVRPFGTLTPDLYALAAWLAACRIVTVAMESTGVYWIPVYELLEARGSRCTSSTHAISSMCRGAILT